MPSPVETLGLVDCAEHLAEAAARRARPPGSARRRRRRAGPRRARAGSAPATPPSSARSRSTASACWMTSISGARSTAAIRARWISAPVASPPACAIRSRWWPPSRVSDSSPSGWWSNCGAERDQLAHGVGPLGHEDADGLDVAGAGAGDERVALVLLGGVARAERRRDAALRPLRRAGVEDVLGDDEQVERRVGGVDPQRGGQPGDAGADHHDVRARGPAGRGCAQAARDRPVSVIRAG